jgi:hypothetical protein
MLVTTPPVKPAAKDRAANDQPASLSIGRKEPVFATYSRKEENPSTGRATPLAAPDGAERNDLLGYAAFLLDQEALYCQQ